MDEPVPDVLVHKVECVGDGTEPEKRAGCQPLEASGGDKTDSSDGGNHDEVAELPAVRARQQEFANQRCAQEEPVGRLLGVRWIP